jgi:hypothetical protein
MFASGSSWISSYRKYLTIDKTRPQFMSSFVLRVEIACGEIWRKRNERRLGGLYHRKSYLKS